MVQTNNGLHGAKRAKKDEFYTQLVDIENEMRHYKDHFKGKTVYCNCDDPEVSNFFKYFSLNFKHLGLKKLITSCYRNEDPSIRTDGVSDKAVWLEYTGEHDDGVVPTAANIGVHAFDGDGDFRSEESIELLKEADIVVTNPPFSLFREYVVQLMEYQKEFIILGNYNAVTYKEIFPYIKANKMWLGVSLDGRNRYFGVPDSYELTEKTGKIENGKKYAYVKSVVWFTNMDHNKRHEELILYKTYNTDDYPIYDNYDGIEVSRVVNIPIDYRGIMGVPITFLNKYNPDQFDIVKFRKGDDNKDLSVNGKCPYFRILIKHKKQEDNPA